MLSMTLIINDPPDDQIASGTLTILGAITILMISMTLIINDPHNQNFQRPYDNPRSCTNVTMLMNLLFSLQADNAHNPVLLKGIGSFSFTLLCCFANTHTRTYTHTRTHTHTYTHTHTHTHTHTNTHPQGGLTLPDRDYYAKNTTTDPVLIAYTVSL